MTIKVKPQISRRIRQTAFLRMCSDRYPRLWAGVASPAVPQQAAPPSTPSQAAPPKHAPARAKTRSLCGLLPFRPGAHVRGYGHQLRPPRVRHARHRGIQAGARRRSQLEIPEQRTGRTLSANRPGTRCGAGGAGNSQDRAQQPGRSQAAGPRLPAVAGQCSEWRSFGEGAAARHRANTPRSWSCRATISRAGCFWGSSTPWPTTRRTRKSSSRRRSTSIPTRKMWC